VADGHYSMCPPSKMATSSSPVKQVMSQNKTKERKGRKKKGDPKGPKLKKCKENLGMGIYVK